MNSNQIIEAKEFILKVSSNIDSRRLNENSQLTNVWNEIVCSIKSNSINGQNIGNNMASHSRISDLKNGILLVEADHPGWIQMLTNYKKYILKGLNFKVPELKIFSLAFKLAGTNASLTDFEIKKQNENERKRLKKSFEKDEKILEKEGFGYKKNEDAKKSLPPEIQKMFDSLKNYVDEE